MVGRAGSLAGIPHAVGVGKFLLSDVRISDAAPPVKRRALPDPRGQPRRGPRSGDRRPYLCGLQSELGRHRRRGSAIRQVAGRRGVTGSMPRITPILISGGSGARLWPLSRRARPKQFHALGGEHTLIQETALRFAVPGYAAPIVVCNAGHEALVREQLAEVGCTPAAVILEPEGRHTAAAAVTSALEAE